jgi:hypothetical protein
MNLFIDNLSPIPTIEHIIRFPNSDMSVKGEPQMATTKSVTKSHVRKSGKSSNSHIAQAVNAAFLYPAIYIAGARLLSFMRANPVMLTVEFTSAHARMFASKHSLTTNVLIDANTIAPKSGNFNRDNRCIGIRIGGLVLFVGEKEIPIRVSTYAKTKGPITLKRSDGSILKYECIQISCKADDEMTESLFSMLAHSNNRIWRGFSASSGVSEAVRHYASTCADMAVDRRASRYMDVS